MRRLLVTDRPGHDRRYAIECAKIEQELGFSPRTTLLQGLTDTSPGTWTTSLGGVGNGRQSLKKKPPLRTASNGALSENWQRRSSLREGEKLGRDHHTGTKIEPAYRLRYADWTPAHAKS